MLFIYIYFCDGNTKTESLHLYKIPPNQFYAATRRSGYSSEKLYSGSILAANASMREKHQSVVYQNTQQQDIKFCQ